MALVASWQATTAQRGPRDRAFTLARRHSRVVRALRVLLPLIGLASIAGFVVVTRFSFPAGLDLDMARLSVTRNSIIMDRPHLTGFDRHHREYTVAARRAIQPLLNPGQVRLEDLEAKFESSEGGMTTVTAEAGDYDHNKNTLKLYGAIVANSPDGYVLHMTDADVDFATGTMATDNPIQADYEQSSLSGKRLSVEDGGKLIVVEGDVRTVVMPPKRPPEAAASETE